MLAARERFFYSRVLIKFKGEFIYARSLRSPAGSELISGAESVLSGPPCRMYPVKGTSAVVIVTALSFKPSYYLPILATDYGVDGPGSNPSRDEIFRPSRPALWPTQPAVKRVPGLSRR